MSENARQQFVLRIEDFGLAEAARSWDNNLAGNQHMTEEGTISTLRKHTQR